MDNKGIFIFNWELLFLSFILVISAKAGAQKSEKFLYQGIYYTYNNFFTESFDDNNKDWKIVGNEMGDNYLSVTNSAYHFNYMAYHVSGNKNELQSEAPTLLDPNETVDYLISFRFRMEGSAPDKRSEFRFG